MSKTTKRGSVELTFNEDSGELEDCVIRVGEPYSALIAANAIDAVTLFYALRHAFGDGKEYTSSVYLLRRAREIGSSWSYIMPLVDRPELFWLCAGPLSIYVSTERMREIFQDFLAVIRAGRELGYPRFELETEEEEMLNEKLPALRKQLSPR